LSLLFRGKNLCKSWLYLKKTIVTVYKSRPHNKYFYDLELLYPLYIIVVRTTLITEKLLAEIIYNLAQEWFRRDTNLIDLAISE